MLKRYVLLFIITSLLISCKSNSRVVTSKSPTKKTNTYTTKKPVVKTKTIDKNTSSTVSSSKQADKIVSKALSFKGTRYKYGGTSKSGMDCSGLMFTSFKSANINLPRTSIAQSSTGNKIRTKDIQKGDLVFFKTGSKNRINHVGLVVSKKGNDVKFIHASTSRGVMISSLREGYWSQAYVKAQRVLKDHKVVSNPEPIAQTNSSKNTYIVKKGDTLYSISRKYNNVSVNDIMKTNNLSSTNLQLGMELQIPIK